MSRGALIRNFFHSGIVSKLLENGIRVVMLTPYRDDPIFKKYQHPNLILEPLIESTNLKLNKLFIELEKGAIFNKTVHIRYKYRVTGRAPNRIAYFLRLLFLAPLRFIPGIKTLVRALDFRINPERQHDYLFEKYQPDLVFSTAAGGDVSIIKSAKRFGIKSVDMPKSWDNLSKFLYNAKADYMIIWSKFMKEQVLRFQGYKENEVFITGAPQFDYYTKEDKLFSREEFCRRFNLNPDKKIILYGSSGGNCCHEMDYIDLLHNYFKNGQLKNIQVLIRPHLGYRNDAERYKQAENYPDFVLDKTAKTNDTLRDNWDTSEEHLVYLFNSLYRADVCVNIGSTLTLDAIACRTPVVNINFDIRPNISPHWSTKRLYGSDYIDAIVKSGGSWVARSQEEFLQSLKDILERGGDKGKKVEQEKMVNYFLYKLDGNSAIRIVDTLRGIIEKNN